jgi:hypothetical protein
MLAATGETCAPKTHQLEKSSPSDGELQTSAVGARGALAGALLSLALSSLGRWTGKKKNSEPKHAQNAAARPHNASLTHDSSFFLKV